MTSSTSTTCVCRSNVLNCPFYQKLLPKKRTLYKKSLCLAMKSSIQHKILWKPFYCTHQSGSILNKLTLFLLCFHSDWTHTLSHRELTRRWKWIGCDRTTGHWLLPVACMKRNIILLFVCVQQEWILLSLRSSIWCTI